jgi:hypothetical protein
MGLALTSWALAPQNARAWGEEGHQIIGLIALKHLNPAVQAKVTQMLTDDPDHLTAPNRADAANWTDKCRDSDRHATQVRYRLNREWHFVDLELDYPDMSAACFCHSAPDTSASTGPAKACVVDRIAAFQAELETLPSTDSERVVALR